MSSPLVLLFLVLPLVAVNGRILGVPTIGMDVKIDGNSVSYFAKLKLNVSNTDIDTEAGFLVDINAKHVFLSSNSCTTAQTPKPRSVGLWSFGTGDSGVAASTADSFLGSIALLCRNAKNTTSVAALSPASTALPSQLSKVGQIPLRFAYSLNSAGGLLLFSKTVWFQYVGIASQLAVSFVQLSLKMDSTAAASYMVKLTGIGFKSVPSSGQGDYVQISTRQRYVTLPAKAYSSVLAEFQQEVSQRKIKSVAGGFGKLCRCYQIKSSDLASFGNLTMVFDGKARWSVPADKYLVAKTGAKDVFCLAVLEAAAGSTGVIGTLLQEGRAMDFNLEKKTLGVSLPLVGPLFSP